MFLWHEHVRTKVRYISTSLVLVFCIIWYICIIAGTEPQDSHACLSDTQMFVASICIVLACKSAAPKVLWYSNYCSQVCSVAAKATAFAHAFLFSILGFVARYLYFPNFWWGQCADARLHSRGSCFTRNMSSANLEMILFWIISVWSSQKHEG